ncbi:transducin family protein / WD-40 repeat family protein [Striga hermonthica]|uniref:Transducin family protein / WD-40 repeat family protein n=1 Tax=Striga hermonthica TaxID=68872 RepID=A0A9N7MKX6_STRHE|nr:transducin family protein / WD-40 repeat family protein [Striga hermonthica]
MATDVGTLLKRYFGACERHGVSPNKSIMTSLFKAKIKKAHHETATLSVSIDDLKDVDFYPLRDLLTEIDGSEIDVVDMVNRFSCALNGEYVTQLLHAVDKKLGHVDICDVSFGKEFLLDIAQQGLTCQVLNLRSSHFRKLNMVGKFVHMHTLNLDFSASLTSFREDCFTCMPNLNFLSLCATRITNLWTTSAALAKLPSLVDLRFQSCFFTHDMEYSSASFGDEGLGSGHTGLGPHGELPYSSDEVFPHLQLILDNEETNDYDEISFSTMDMHDDDYFSAGSVKSSGVKKCISRHPSPICFEKHYREYMIASLPKLSVLDNLRISKTDKEKAKDIFTSHFEYLPYNRHNKESLVSLLQQRETSANLSATHASRNSFSFSLRKTKHFYSRSLSAAKMGSSAWPALRSLSITGSSLREERRNFRPRQFEYHPTDSSLMVIGTLDGEVVIVNHENGKIVSYIPSLGALNSVLGLCWLKKYPSKLIAGSDNGSLRLYDIRHYTSRQMHHNRGSVFFDDFDQLTSVHVNSTDELFVVSGYSKDVALYDIGSGKLLQVFANMHWEHINVVKFSNHNPFLFATSSFDQDVKMWDVRQKPNQPCYTASSSRGNVMVCFSPDDHYLLVSAVDNEVKQLLAVDGRLHMDFGIASTGSSQNYTRSYYMNGRDYVVSGSCDEHVVRICCANTGRRLRDVSLEGRGAGASMFVQSLRGDPFRDFNMSILAAYVRPNSDSEIVKV